VSRWELELGSRFRQNLFTTENTELTEEQLIEATGISDLRLKIADFES
jgi:hypothetical protein